MDSRSTLRTISHALSFFVFPINLWGIFCILKVNTNSMKLVKFHLLNLHIWSTIFDLVVGSFIIPYFFFPILAGLPSGLLSDYGVEPIAQIFVSFFCFGGTCSSIILLFENRQSVICKHSQFRISRKSLKISYYCFVYTFSCFIVYPISWNIPEDQIEAKKICLAYLEIGGDPSPEFYSKDNFIFKTPDGSWGFVIFSLIFVIFMISQIVFFGFGCIYNLYLLKANQLSNHKKQTQRSFFISICIQIFAPFVTIFLTLTYFLYSMYFVYYNQVLNNITSLLFSCYGFFSTIFLLTMNSPYRNYTLNSFFWKIKEDKTNVTIVSRSFAVSM